MTVTKKQVVVAAVVLGAIALISQVSTVSTFAQLPPASLGGRILGTLDSWLFALDTGTSYNYFGPIYQMTLPTLASFTPVDCETTSATQAYGGINLAFSGTLTTFCKYTIAQPTPPYTITAALTYTGGINEVDAAIGFREAGTAKILLIDMNRASGGAGFDRLEMVGATTFQALTTFAGVGNRPTWFRMANTGTRCRFYLSADGANYVLMADRLFATDFTTAPDQVWFGGFYSTDATATMTLMSWKVTQP